MRELDELMEVELTKTFQAVAEQFEHFFKLLFNGGTAKLVLTEPDDITSTGVEIIARPPGKRPQSLALLSGGERTLSACALIFAILRVSPTPFCVLDEVDAALDEANVRPLPPDAGRFERRHPVHHRDPQPAHAGRRQHDLRRHHGQRRGQQDAEFAFGRQQDGQADGDTGDNLKPSKKSCRCSGWTRPATFRCRHGFQPWRIGRCQPELLCMFELHTILQS
ncbi:MAG: hypothetical protein R2838_19405 [Caldilineaceae bacterium]